MVAGQLAREKKKLLIMAVVYARLITTYHMIYSSVINSICFNFVVIWSPFCQCIFINCLLLFLFMANYDVDDHVNLGQTFVFQVFLYS